MLEEEEEEVEDGMEGDWMRWMALSQSSVVVVVVVETFAFVVVHLDSDEI